MVIVGHWAGKRHNGFPWWDAPTSNIRVKFTKRWLPGIRHCSTPTTEKSRKSCWKLFWINHWPWHLICANINTYMTSWNKGKTGIAAGWSDERRRQASIKQRAWCKANPNSNFFKYDSQSRWKTGPDPEVRKHYYRFLRMRCQAKYWCQEWTILWEDYLDLLKSSSAEWGRSKDCSLFPLLSFLLSAYTSFPIRLPLVA